VKYFTVLIAVCLLACDHPKIGDTWVWQADNGPFGDCQKSTVRHTYRVLDVKKGWVKSIDENGHVECDTESWFMTGATRTKRE
jgi:hypothetical protein